MGSGDVGPHRAHRAGVVAIDGYDVRPLTAERFDDFVHVIGRGGIGGCWCMYWTRPTTAEFGAGAKGGSTAANRTAFAALVESGPPPGLLAYDGGEAVGWCRVMRRADLPGLTRSRNFKTDLPIDDVWSLACFVVRRTHRGKGLTEVLTRAAIELVRGRGGGILEAYPAETAQTRSPASVYLGLASTFERLGFEVVQRTAPDRPMMRLAVPAGPPGR